MHLENANESGFLSMLAVPRASCSPAGLPRLFACAISVGDIRTRCRRHRRHRPRRRRMYVRFPR
jgi:hypothetical protein